MTKPLLRLITCGSVDGGKSTLVGRMLYDAGLVPADQFESIRKHSTSNSQSGDLPDFSLLLDGLLDERAQRITIDVAWRYFETGKRKFILADAPGHEQYTSNMATGASRSDLALILLDAQKGVMSQTRRHAAIVHLMAIQQVTVVVNKMDLVGWDESAFLNVQRDFLDFAKPFGITEPAFVPVSALQGDNLVNRSTKMPWYTGPTLLEYLESVDVEVANIPLRFPVQWVVRTTEFRGYGGSVVSGECSRGLPVTVLPAGVPSRIASITTFDGELERASAGNAVTITLEDEVDVTRGDVIVAASDRSSVVTDRFDANLVWMAQEPLLAGRRYELRIGTSSVPATVKRLIHRLNLETMHQELASRLQKNDIGQCEVMTERPVPCDLYARCRETGSFILIDRISNATVAAGMVTMNETRKVFWEAVSVDKQARANAKGQQPRVIWFTGLSGAGKSTIADAVEQTLFKTGMHTYLIDGDNIRHGISRDLGFSVEDRIENSRRVGELAKLMTDAGLIVLVSLISPFRAERRMVRELFERGEFFEVYMSTPLEVCESRDTKGLYRLARDGKLKNFTGISSPYEAPEAAELVLDTSVESIETCVLRVVDLVMGR